MRYVKSPEPPKNCCCKRHSKQNGTRVRFSSCDCIDCKYFFQINLAGLNNHLNQKLFKLEDYPLTVVTDLGCSVRGKTHDIGIDFVDVLTKNGLVLTVLKDKIDHIRWSLKDCNPHHHKCRNHHDC